MRNRSRKQRGFSLMEILVAVAILLAVTAIVFGHIATVQQRARVEEGAVENLQDSRAAMDLLVRDLHSAGYPNYHQYSSTVGLTMSGTTSEDPRAANGVYTLTGTRLVLEGDVNSDGKVEQVIYQVVSDPSGTSGKCPCVLQRAQVTKVSGSLPDTYGNSTTDFVTIAGGIINSNGTMSIAGTTYNAQGTAITLDTQYSSYKSSPAFTALYSDGTNDQNFPGSGKTLRAVIVNLNVMGTLPDPKTGLMPVATLVSSNRVYQPQ